MDIFEILEKVGYYGKRYLLPTIFLVIGLYLLKMAVIPVEEVLADGRIYPVEQSSGFLYASLFFLLASIVWFLYLLEIVQTTVGYAIMGVLVICSIYLIVTDFSTIKTKVDYDVSHEIRDLDIRARMDDLKQAEIAYKEMNGIYTASMDDLIAFVKTGKKMKILKEGSIPERKISIEEREYLYQDDRPLDKFMTEIEAAALAKSPFAKTDTTGLDGFIRDTLYVPVMEAIFLDEKRIATRDKIGASLDFHVDSLRYVPHSKIPVTLSVGSIIKGESLKVSTVLIEMYHPMIGEKDDTLFYSIGSLTENHLRESWKD
ncbi:MAG: hypothetical protein GQ574_08165 [Crocinitomix sp.]|nr:hypothetical protein [Crocinitomix sp.]